MVSIIELFRNIAKKGVRRVSFYSTGKIRQLANKNTMNPLFSDLFYLEKNPDVAASNINCWVHYVKYGWKEGRSPNPIFNTRWYIENNSDINFSKINPLDHYYYYGWKEGRDPSPYFSVKYYLATNADVRESNSEPLHHYLEYGGFEDRDPHPLFDTKWYKSIIGSKHENALVAFISRGECESPHPLFDSCYYCEQNGDVENGHAFWHFLTIGNKYGRSPTVLFSSEYYSSQFSKGSLDDVVLFDHYLDKGWKSKISPHPLFDVKWYLSAYQDITEAGVEPLSHYIKQGWKEGRFPNPVFNTLWYYYQNMRSIPDNYCPLCHYSRWGYKDRWNPNPQFDSQWYSDQYLENKEEDPLAHYLLKGYRTGNKTNSLGQAFYYSTSTYSSILPLSHSDVLKCYDISRPLYRVLMICGEDYIDATCQYRALNQKESFYNINIDVAVVNSKCPLVLFSAFCDQARFVIFQRCRASNNIKNMIEYAKKEGKICIGDLDDLLFTEYVSEFGPVASGYWSLQMGKEYANQVNDVLRQMDAFFASTDMIASKLKEQYKKPTIVLSNRVRIFPDNAKEDHREKQKQLRLLYASGSSSHNCDFIQVFDQLIEACIATGSRLTILGNVDVPETITEMKFISLIPYVPYQQMLEIFRVHDIVLVPLVKNNFNNAKSCLKYIEAGSVKTPVIASDVDEYRKVIRQHINGLLVYKNCDWYNSIVELEKEKVVEMGENAFRDVIKKYATNTSNIRVVNFLGALKVEG